MLCFWTRSKREPEAGFNTRPTGYVAMSTLSSVCAQWPAPLAAFGAVPEVFSAVTLIIHPRAQRSGATERHFLSFGVSFLEFP